MNAPLTSRVTRIGRGTKIAAAVAAIVGFVITVGSTPAIGEWTTNATVSSSATTPAVSITHSGFDTLGTTFLHSTPDQRGGFTITNTGNTAGRPTLHVTATGTLADDTHTFVWQTTSVAACQDPMPSTVAQGTWAAFPSLDLGTLAEGASTAVCVRSWAADPDLLAEPSGTRMLTADASATLIVGGWEAPSSPATATLKTQFIYPLATGYATSGVNNWYVIKPVSDPTQCLDSFNRGTNVGNTIGVWACGGASNQRFEILPTQNGKSALRPKTAAEQYVGQSNGVTVQATTGTSATDWRVERITAATYQIVHSDSGLCLQAGTNAQNQLRACTGATSQQFTLSREPLGCSVSGTEMTLDYKAPSTNRYYTTQYKLGEGDWSDAYREQSWGVNSSTFPVSVFGTQGTLDVRIIDSAGNVLYRGMTIVVSPGGTTCGTGFV